MKKTITTFACLLLSMLGLAQNNANLIIFSEDLEPFYAYINGVRQNNKPETNVRFTGISPNIALRIEFENKALPVIKQNMALEPGFEHTARLKRDKNKVMKLRYFGQVPMEEAVADKAVATVEYHTSETPLESNTSVTDNNASINTNINTNIESEPISNNVSVTTTTRTTRVTNNNTDKAAMNVTMPGININMNVSDPNMGDVHSTTSTTVTTTSSSSSSSSSNTTKKDNYPGKPKPTPAPAPAPAPATAPAPANANAGCSVAMSSSAFSKMKATVESKPFSDTKMSTAKVATKSNCLSVEQVMEIAKLFSMDDDKLAYAKYAYNYCVDKGNYYQVSEVFSFSSTTEDFNKFLDK